MCDWGHAQGCTCEKDMKITLTRKRALCIPGWPELALPTTSTARVRIVAIATSSAGSAMNFDIVKVVGGLNGSICGLS